MEKIRLLRGREIVALRKEKDRRRRKLAPVPGPVVFKGRARKPWTGRQFRVRLARLLAED